MVTDCDCPLCSGFGWVPLDRADPSNWYQRDWRVLLDPTVAWGRCPHCRKPVDLTRLHDDLAAIMLQKLQQEVADWVPDGPWLVGVLDGFRRVYRWQDLACLCRSVQPRRWAVLSTGGVSDDLDDTACRRLLRKAGAPVLRVLG
jgi:hypothetical protein